MRIEQIVWPLRALRLLSEKTASQVAKELGITQRNLYKYETGERVPQITEWVPYAESLGITFLQIADAMLRTQTKRKELYETPDSELRCSS